MVFQCTCDKHLRMSRLSSPAGYCIFWNFTCLSCSTRYHNRECECAKTCGRREKSVFHGFLLIE